MNLVFDELVHAPLTAHSYTNGVAADADAHLFERREDSVAVERPKDDPVVRLRLSKEDARGESLHLSDRLDDIELVEPCLPRGYVHREQRGARPQPYSVGEETETHQGHRGVKAHRGDTRLRPHAADEGRQPRALESIGQATQVTKGPRRTSPRLLVANLAPRSRRRHPYQHMDRDSDKEQDHEVLL